MKTPTHWFLLTAFAFTVGLAPVRAAAPENASRDRFLRLIDRPRVPLAAEVQTAKSNDGLDQIAFSFSAEPSQRVPGILVKASSSTGRRPVVIALHGTGGTKESQLELLSNLAREGFIAVAIDGRYHGARTKAGKGSAEYNDAVLRAFRAPPDQPGREHPFFFDTAFDVMRLVDYLISRDDVDAARIGLIGFSKGGIEAYLAAAADPRIAVVVPCIGLQSFRWALDHGTWPSRIETIQPAFDAAAKDTGVSQPDASFVRTFYDRVAPGIYGEFDGPAMVRAIAPRPLLAINGATDARTPLPGLNECADAARNAYRALGAEENFVLLVQPDTGHKVTPDALKTAHAWFVRWLKP